MSGQGDPIRANVAQWTRTNAEHTDAAASAAWAVDDPRPVAERSLGGAGSSGSARQYWNESVPVKPASGTTG